VSESGAIALIDSHCHLDFPDFAGDLDGILDRARSCGVKGFLTIGTRISQFQRVLDIAEKNADVHCTLGIHPHEAVQEPEVDAARLVDMARHPRIVGIGEAGLDYYYDKSPREAQQRVFATHIEAAGRSGLPIVVHSRDADEDTAAMLQEGARNAELKGVIHCFTAGAGLAKAALELGFYISLSGIVTFKNAEALRQIARTIPLDRLLVETDAPYLAPAPMRGKRNEPGFVRHTAEFLAQLLDIELAALASATTENFYRLFRKIERATS
jgi:TatD DNase family protein